MANQRTVQEYI